jgi:hypothetical protein
MTNFFRKCCVAAFLLVVLFSAALARAQTQISTNIPGVSAAGNPCDFVFSFYKFAMMISGVLAFGAIVYGGVKYTLAAGNPSGQSEGKEWVKGALLGLFLLVSAYLILNVINPDLTKCTLPQFPKISGVGGGSITTTGGGAAGCPNCAYISGTGFYCKSASSCTANPAMISELQCIVQKSGVALKVTEAYPPTVSHISQCHNDGCCIDTAINSFQDCSQVQAVVDAAHQCGAIAVANEYASCGGTTYDTTTGNNIHIQACN